MESVIGTKADVFIQLKDYPWLLAAFCVTIVIVAAVIAAVFIIRSNPGVVSKLVESRVSSKKGLQAKLDGIETMLSEDRDERAKRKAEFDKRFDIIEREIKNLYSIAADNEELMAKTSQGTLENMLFNESLPPFRRLRALRRLVALGVNGRVKEKGLKLILENKETWKDVMDTNLDIKIVNREYYDKVMTEISRHIFDY